jgi:hypothetical protein
MSALHTAIGYLAPLADPSPGGYNGPAVGNGTPPGAQQFSTILGWAAYIASGVCVLGIIITGGMLAISHRGGGGGGEHASKLGWIFAGCVLIGSATFIVGALS